MADNPFDKNLKHKGHGTGALIGSTILIGFLIIGGINVLLDSLTARSSNKQTKSVQTISTPLLYSPVEPVSQLLIVRDSEHETRESRRWIPEVKKTRPKHRPVSGTERATDEIRRSCRLYEEAGLDKYSNCVRRMEAERERLGRCGCDPKPDFKSKRIVR